MNDAPLSLNVVDYSIGKLLERVDLDINIKALEVFMDSFAANTTIDNSAIALD